MWKLFSTLSAMVGAIILWLLAQPAMAQPHPAAITQAVQAIEQLDQLRSGLAATLEGQTEPPTAQTMKEVCRPVGMQAQRLSAENGWQVQQIASKYRNPAHKPDNEAAEAAIAVFEQHPELMGFWQQETLNGQAGLRYYRRINVEASCLGCHGAKDSRPAFIQKGYPDDLAYDFQAGDLRGMYAVFLPDVQQALESVTQE